MARPPVIVTFKIIDKIVETKIALLLRETRTAVGPDGKTPRRSGGRLTDRRRAAGQLAAFPLFVQVDRATQEISGGSGGRPRFNSGKPTILTLEKLTSSEVDV